MEPEHPVERVPPVHAATDMPPVVDGSEIPAEYGDPDVAFAAFYREHRNRIARGLALTLRDGHLAAEAVDEAMARAYQRWSRVATYNDPAGWVYRVALNWSTSVLRRRARAPRIASPSPDTELEPLSEPSLLTALASLERNQRAVIVCRFFLGWNEAETAAALGTRPGTVKSRLHRGLRALERQLPHLRPEGIT